MDKELHKMICDKLESGKSLGFQIDKPKQGGHVVSVSLNDKLIGEVYQYDKNLERYVNVLKGNDLEKDLGVNVKEWIHNDFFDYVSNNDELLGDSYDCFFYFDKNGLYLRISGVRTWDEEKERFGGKMKIELLSE